MEVTDWISTGANVVMAAAAVYASWLARRALQTWKDELRGQTRYELARRLIQGVQLAEKEATSTFVAAIRIRQVQEPGLVGVYQQAQQFRTAAEELEAVVLEAEAVVGSDPVREVKRFTWMLYRIHDELTTRLVNLSSEQTTDQQVKEFEGWAVSKFGQLAGQDGIEAQKRIISSLQPLMKL